MSQYVFEPQPGPQVRLARSYADIVIFGGQASGGKTVGLLSMPLRHLSVKGYGAVIFRRTFPEITQEGGLWDEALKMYIPLGGKPNSNEHYIQWPHSGVTVSFAHLQHEKDKYDYQGGQIPLIGFDELTHFTESQFWYLFSRNRSTCGVKSRIICGTNPDADSWVRGLVDFYVGDDGYIDPKRDCLVRFFVRNGDELRWFDKYPQALSFAENVVKEMSHSRPDPKTIVKSFQFINSKITDNKIFMAKDPGYIGKLASLSTVERERLLMGNWNIRYQAGNVFKGEHFRIIDAIPNGIRRKVRYWDRAATQGAGDYTVGALLSIGERNDVIIEDIVRGQWSPSGVESIIKSTASRDGNIDIWLEQEPGSSGVADVQYIIRSLIGHRAYANKKTGSKLDMAKPLAAQLEVGNVSMVRAKWNDELVRECESFDGTGSGHDDQVDAVSGAFIKLSKKPGSFGTL